MAKLRAYYLNGGDMFELARYQEEELPMAAGAEMETVLSAYALRDKTHNELGEIGRWHDRIPYCELPVNIKKKLTIQHHIAGL